MELQSLVEKITREVMDSMEINNSPTASGPPRVPAGGTKTRTALLLAGSPTVGPALIESAVRHLRSSNFSVTVAVNGDARRLNFEGASSISCHTPDDCRSALANAGLVVLLMCGTDSLSRLAGLMTERFDIASCVWALKSGVEVWALDAMDELPGAMGRKASQMISEIESYGVKVTRLCAKTSDNNQGFQPVIRASTIPPSSGCSNESNGDCSGCGLCVNLATDKVQQVIDQGAQRVSASTGVAPVDTKMAAMIDHTLLKPDATREQILKLCSEAREYNFASCCVNPTWVPTVAEALRGSPVKTCVVIGFPLGANSTVVKSMETRDAVAAGADEVDMVINVGALKAGDYQLVQRDIEAVVEAAQGRIVKVILETALLTDEEKIKACQLSQQAGADFVKTSTGFGPGGATVEDIALMRRTVGKYMGVKASGGIRDQEKALAMVKAGATRIGASASIAIVRGDKPGGKGY